MKCFFLFFIYVFSVFGKSHFYKKLTKIKQDADADTICLYTRWGRGFTDDEVIHTQKYQVQIILRAESKPNFTTTKFLQRYGKICNFIQYKGVTATLSRSNLPWDSQAGSLSSSTVGVPTIISLCAEASMKLNHIRSPVMEIFYILSPGEAENSKFTILTYMEGNS